MENQEITKELEQIQDKEEDKKIEDIDQIDMIALNPPTSSPSQKPE